jgi:hypothetical protein
MKKEDGAFQKMKCPLKGTYIFFKCPTICRG